MKPGETERMDFLRELLRWINQNRLLTLGSVITFVFVIGTVCAPLLTIYDPARVNYPVRLQPPSAEHLFGTDEHGRDIFSRVLYGGRTSLEIGLAATVISASIGVPLGLLAGFFGGVFSMTVERVMDALFAFPNILLAIALAVILGQSPETAIVAIGLTRIPVTVRIVRTAILVERRSDYVEASRALGSPWHFIIFRSILPNIASTVIVLLSLGFAVAVLAEAGLSYLGLSVQPPDPTWGNMLDTGQAYLRDAPWYTFFPGAAIFLSVLGLNLLGDGLRDLLDPRRGRIS